MDTTPNLTLPYILASQAQKHVTHNEAVRALDALVHLMVLDQDLATPPGAPADGDRYIVAASPSGDWTGQAGKIAAYQDAAWAFHTPREGWTAWVADEHAHYVWTGSAWVQVASPGTGAPLWGINATADTTNRLAVASDASLFDNAGTGHQLKINKNAAGDTASTLYQTGYSGRAQYGLTGDDDFHVKVSPDGSAWTEAIVVDRTSGAARFPQTALANPDLIINADGRIDQRSAGAAATTADDAYGGPDRWYSLTQTASIEVQRKSDGEDGMPFFQRLTQTQAGAQRMGRGQIIESANCRHLRGQALTLSGRLRCSSSQAVRYAVLEWIGTADVVTSDVVNSWTNGSFTAGQFFNSTTLNVLGVGALTPSASTWTDLTALAVTAGSSMTNLIVLIWTEGTAAQNVTLDFRLKLEAGRTATRHCPRGDGTELALCQRYYYRRQSRSNNDPINVFTAFSSTALWGVFFDLPVQMRAVPTVAISSAGHLSTWSANALTSAAVTTIFGTSGSSDSAIATYNGLGIGSAVLTIGQAAILYFNTTSGYIEASAEL